MRLVTVNSMRALDRVMIAERNVSGAELMERAGRGAADEIINYTDFMHQSHVKRFVLLAGKGNNGGDAYVAARFLAQEKPAAKILVYSVCELSELKGEALLNAQRMPEKVQFQLKKKLAAADFQAGDIIIDGLLGTGVKGPLKEPYQQWIELVNSLHLPVIALDIPSGLNGDSGTAATCAIKADLTITIGFPKWGFIKNNGPENCGLLRCVDIGIADELLPVRGELPEIVFQSDIAPFFKRLSMLDHKNRRGRILIIGGSYKYHGAPLLAAQSAAAGGAGYVALAVPASANINCECVKALVSYQVRDNGRGTFSKESIHEIGQLIDRCDAVVIGPGLTDSADLIPLIEYIGTIDKPVVYDADALNLIAQVPEIYGGGDNHVLTPHAGEMRRLIAGFELDECLNYERLEQALSMAVSLDTTIVLKGFRTVTASPDGRAWINGSGSPALATAGSGDCLSGLIGAFMSGCNDSFSATAAAVFVHGLAGEIYPHGQRGLIADDLIGLIPQAMWQISPFA